MIHNTYITDAAYMCSYLSMSYIIALSLFLRMMYWYCSKNNHLILVGDVSPCNFALMPLQSLWILKWGVGLIRSVIQAKWALWTNLYQAPRNCIGQMVLPCQFVTSLVPYFFHWLTLGTRRLSLTAYICIPSRKTWITLIYIIRS